ncbi:hypothetical protein OAP38_00400 [Opitutales bacterium]|nr:hypothetical protein [Opitutales bacterium]
MDYDLENENDGLGKGPFYGAAAFLFLIIALFAFVTLKEQGTLGHWEIASCLLGTGLISILLFLPHFLAGIIDRIEEKNTQADSDLASKAFYELKEVRSELDALAVKVDKVPTLVDKIVSDSPLQQAEQSPDTLIEKLTNLENQINSKLDRIEEASLTQPLISENDSDLNALKETLGKLIDKVGLLQEKVDFIADSPQGKTPIEKDPIVKEKITEEVEQTAIEEIGFDLNSDDKLIEPSFEEANTLKEEEEEPEILPDDISNDQIEDPKEETLELLEDEEEEEEEPVLDPDIEPGNLEKNDSLPEPEREDDYPEQTITQKEPEFMEKDVEENLPEELDLGLPDPEETLRKVDALLAGEESSSNVDKPETSKENKENSGPTTVVANVMIGIGNKPYLRGEGPGLSWDEGVSMNFIEIGKWAWSSPRKNASLIVQVYRNDQDPDKGGKIEVKPGQKLEITPDFS